MKIRAGRVLTKSAAYGVSQPPASPHPSPRHVMIVQVIGFAGLSVKEGILAVLSTEAKARRSRAVVRGRVIW